MARKRGSSSDQVSTFLAIKQKTSQSNANMHLRARRRLRYGSLSMCGDIQLQTNILTVILQVRKGITGKDAINDRPGRPSDPSTFLETESNEQKTAAYLGYSKIAHLRQLVISWPLMKSYPQFDVVCRGLSRKNAFLMIIGDENAYTDVNPDQKWPLGDDLDNSIRSRHIAAILLQVEKDLKEYRFAPQKNAFKNTRFRKQFTQKYPDLTIADYDRKCPAPELGPLEKEHRLESINRCWVLLRYMRYCIQAKSWDSRFSNAGVDVGVSVAPAYIPGWMRASDTIVPPEITPQEEVAATDTLTPIVVTVVWERNQRFPGYDELMSVLKTAREKGIVIPDNQYQLPDNHDPRLFESIFPFKDCLRRLYKCPEIGMDIEGLYLEYIITSSEEERSVNILIKKWKETLSIFDNKDFSSFKVKVLFAAVKDNGVSLFESFDPLPALTSFFTTAESDFTVNVQNVNKNLIEYLESIPASNSDEVGHPPEPKAFDNKDDFTAYYSGFDVETEEGKRRFQREVLYNLTCNAKSARVTQEMLSSDLGNDDRQIISEIQEAIRQDSIEEESYVEKVWPLFTQKYFPFRLATGHLKVLPIQRPRS